MALTAVSAQFWWRDGPQTCWTWPFCFPSRAHVMSAPHPVRRAWRCLSRLPPLVDLPQKHRDAQPLACGLAWQELLLALRQMSTLAVMPRLGVSEEARAQEHGMLPILLPQRVHTLIQM